MRLSSSSTPTGCRARPRRLRADVDERSSLGHETSRVRRPRPTGDEKRPPSEKLSGVTFTTPMTAGRGQRSSIGRRLDELNPVERNAARIRGMAQNARP